MRLMGTHKRSWRHAGTGTGTDPRNRQDLAAAVPVAVVAIIAAIVSYGHIEALALAHHQTIAQARLLPFVVDFLIVAGSWIVLRGYWLGWLCVVCGVAATVFANIESGLPFGAMSATIAAWPAIAFTVASFVLERWLKRQGEAVTHRDVMQDALEAERASLEIAEADLDTARAELAEAAAKETELARKLTAALTVKRTRNQRPKPTGTRTRKQPAPAPEPAPEVTPEPVPEPAAEETVDVDAEARILQLIGEGHSPSKAGILAGKSDSYGRKVARTAQKLAEAAPRGQDPKE